MEYESAPEWLNGDFLKPILAKEVKGENISVIMFNVEPAVPKGDNFGSCLYRVIVEFTFQDETKSKLKETSHFIIKSLPTGEMIRMMALMTGTFKREIKMYKIILPAIYKLQQEKFGSNAHHFSTTCFYAEQDILAIKDLCQLGYRMAERRKGLDLCHCKIALKSLARYHGLSVGIFNQEPEIMSDMTEGFYKEELRQMIEPFFVPGIIAMTSAIEKWDGYERFGDKFRNLTGNLIEKIIEVVKPVQDSLSVLNHGDFWINNIMFRYKEETNNPLDAMFIDFQMPRYSSPCLDLQCFICTSVSDDVWDNHIDELLEFYHQELRETLTTVGCGHVQFSLQQLKREFDDKGLFGFITACTLLQLVLTDPKDAFDVNEMKEENLESVMNVGFNNPLFRNRFQKVLIYYENKGVI